MKHFYLLIGVILTFPLKSNSYQCNSIPERALKEPSKVNKYVIEISGNPKNYTPGENYTITLKSNPSDPSENRFYEFMLVVESENPSDSHFGKPTGSFHLIDPVISMFSTQCPNTVIHTNTLAKTSVNVLWNAPSSGSGCVLIRGTVLESGSSWYTDSTENSQLRKRLCEDNKENDDVPPKILDYCCACNEAKYEVAFQGTWSRNTHPKDFPDDVWKTKLGDIIGASHKYSKSFWDYGTKASDGLKLLAEEGDTSGLENELKEMVKNDDIRTIIKARELSHPKITGTSYTVFRVDQENHLMSLVSKITPSPDWIVGVANLELCLESCEWAESRTLNLYPWDVGTNDGLTYTANVTSTERQVIRRIKSNSPNREESPFYSPDGEPIKPLAKLYLTRLKIYEKECKDAQEEVVHHQPDNKCNFGEWGDWSSCSVTCGRGVKTRERPLLPSKHYNQCLQDSNVVEQLQETVECDSSMPCENEPIDLENDCPNTKWGPWTPCTATCGTGTRTRVRQDISDIDYNENNDEDEDVNMEEENENRCTNYKETVLCFNPPCVPGALSQIIVDQSPDGEVIDCKVTKWSVWGPCDISQPCRKRYKMKERHILVHAQNGGKACPKKLQRKKKCGCRKISVTHYETNSTNSLNLSTEKVVDCEMGPWSRWSPCSTTCGHSVQQRTRNILVYPSKNGKPCERRVDYRKCSLPQTCNGRGMSGFYR